MKNIEQSWEHGIKKDLFMQVFDDGEHVQLIVEGKSCRIIRANPAAASFYGWSPSALKGMDFRALTAMSSEQMDEIGLDPHTSRRMYCKQELRSGDLRNVSIYMVPIVLDKIPCYYVVVIDESKKAAVMKRYIHELQKSELIVNDVDDGILLMDTDKHLAPQTIVDIGSAVAHRLGYTREALIGKPVDRVFPFINGSKVQATLAELRAKGEAHTTIRERISGSRQAVVEIKAHTLRHANRDFILAITREVSNPMQVRKERDNQNKMFCSLFQNVPEAMFLLDDQLMIVDLNAPAENLFGMDKQAVLHTDLREWIMHAEQRKESEQVLEMVRRGRICNRPVQRYTVDGNRVNLMLTAYEATLPDGRWGMMVSYEPMGNTSNDRLFGLLYQDSVTGLDNRDAFFNRITRAIAENRAGGQMYLLYFDVHLFRQINDTRGHLFGDAVLRKVGSILKDALYPNDSLARLGGDRYACLLYAQSASEVMKICQEALRQFDNPVSIMKEEVQLDLYAGIAAYPAHGDDEEVLMSNAELALDQAKTPSGQRICMFSQALRNSAMGAYQVREGLRNALSEQEITLNYQPIVNMTNKKIVGFESLMRWNSGRFGQVSPARFIPLAEQNGMIQQLGRWAMEQAANDLPLLKQIYGDHLFMSVNVSAVQLQRRDFIRDLCSVLERYPESAGLDIELTESAYMRDYFQLNRTLQALKSMGVSVTIDDFGTGYSSLGKLTALHIDKVKIDQSFVRGIEKNERSSAVIRAVIGMFNELDKPLVAEGIETREQYDWLVRRGCQYGQGYWFSRPQPLAYWRSGDAPTSL